jgi:class 3 adenylate cyclase
MSSLTGDHMMRRPRRKALSIRQLATERKFVTILRADLHRSTGLVVELELEDALGRLAPALEQMRQAVHAQDGIIHRELGDGLFAIFGAPIANDHHAVMACLAAFDLQARIAALKDEQLKVRIGLHTGELVVGPRALDLGSTYEFDGPALILAERLQAAAEPGQVLVSSSCRALAEGYVRFGDANALTLRGFPRPVPVHVALGIGGLSRWQIVSRRSRTNFVGRQAELAELLSLTGTAAREKRGIRMGISGEAGVGKSRLAHGCLDALSSRGYQVIAAECSAVLGSTPFSTLKTLLSETALALGADSLKALEARLPATQAAALTVLLSTSTGAAADPPTWTTLPPQARRRAVIAASQALVGEATKAQPTVLLLEDLQWVDEASVASMQAIVALASRLPLIVIATARSAALPQWFASRAEFALHLSALDRSGALDLLEVLLGPSPQLAPLKQRILEHTGGMPLFLEEVCRWLVETGALRGEWGGFEPHSSAPSLGVPPTVQGVIASRVDQLGGPTKRVLQVAAAIGPNVRPWLLQAVAGDGLRRALDSLARASMLLPQADDGKRHAPLRFAHDLVRQVAYDALLGAERRNLHNRILDALESADAAQYGPPEEGALAHHALSAQRWAKAADYSAAIARRCFARSALPDSCRHYELALQSLDRLDASRAREERAIDLRLEARLAYSNAGQTAVWLELAKQAEMRSKAIGDGVRHVAALAVQAAALNFCGMPMDALAAGTEAIAQAKRHDKPGWLAYAEYGMGQACYIAGRYREAVVHLDNARRRFAMEGATPPMGGSSGQAGLLCCMMACLCHAALGEDEAALDMQQLADEIATREQRPLATIGALYCKGAVLLRQRQPAESETVLAQALELANRLEINLFIPVLACLQALALLLLGRREEMKAALDVADRAATAVGHHSASLRIALYRAVERSIAPQARAQGLTEVRSLISTARQEGFDPLVLEALLVEAALDTSIGDAAAQEVATRTGAVGTMQDIREYLGRLIH